MIRFRPADVVMTMILSHRICIDATVKQQHYFAQACGTARMVWNWALEHWNSEYAAGGKPSGAGLKRQFNSVKYELSVFACALVKANCPWLKEPTTVTRKSRQLELVGV